MIKRLTIFVILLQTSCVKKDPDYWIQPENQKGIIMDFYATPEYCNLMKKNYPKIFRLNQLAKEKERILKNWNQQDSLPKVKAFKKDLFEKLDHLYKIMIDSCGGRCITSGLPVLPYREKDVQRFWNESRLTYLKEIIRITFSNFQRLDSSMKRSNIDWLTNRISQFKNSNTVQAMILFKEIELELLIMTKLPKE